MPQRKSIRSSNNRKLGDKVTSRRTNTHKPVCERHRVRQVTERLKQTITAVLCAAFLWLFVFQAVYRVILHFAEAYLFLLRSCVLIVVRLVTDCRLLLDSVRQIFWYIWMLLFRLCSYCIHLPVDLVQACKNITLDTRAVDVVVACSSPLRQGILACVLVLECCGRAARRGGYFLTHCLDSVFTITSLVSQVIWQFILAIVHALKSAQDIAMCSILSYVCMAQVALRFLLDCVNAVVGIARLLQRLARWLWQDVERGVESVFLEVMATTWQILRTTVILTVYSVIICVRLVQVIGSWSLALCWGAPWASQPAPATKKSYPVQSRRFQTTGEYLVDLVLSLAH